MSEVLVMPFTIRPLRVDEAVMYRDIRLEALRLHPERFSASFEQEAARPLAFFEDRLTGNVVFGGFRDDVLLATAGFRIQPGAKSAHKGMLWGMYVRLEARGSGLARRMVEAVLGHAGGRVELVQLTVVADNVHARRLYVSCGFEPYGTEQRALKLEGRYLDEVLMVRRLT
jgi:RimJ/RimL family protein N-acetyltransferase